MDILKAYDAERVYTYIMTFIQDNGYPPRIQDIRKTMDWSAPRLAHALVCLRISRRICMRSTLPRIYLKEPLPSAASSKR